MAEGRKKQSRKRGGRNAEFFVEHKACITVRGTGTSEINPAQRKRRTGLSTLSAALVQAINSELMTSIVRFKGLDTHHSSNLLD